MKKVADIVLCVFVAAIVITGVLFFNYKPNQTSVIEKRILAEPVSINEGLTDFMYSVECAVNDRIAFRDYIMKYYNKFIYFGLRGSHRDVMVGDDGWLFYRDDLADYTGTNIDREKTQKQVEIIKTIDKWCKERNITFIMAIGLNKSTIYNNYMPKSILGVKKSNADYLVEMLRAENILVSYPKEELIRNRDEKELYMRLDTHWNAYGAGYMFNDIIKIMGLSERDFMYDEEYIMDGDLLNMMGAGWNNAYSFSASVQENPEAVVEKIPGTDHMYIHYDDAIKIVCYRDSFHFALVPFYEYYFEGPIRWTFDIDFDMVEQEKPKYLIFSCVERFLDEAIEENEDILNMSVQ